MLREVGTIGGPTPGGYIWSILMPVVGILILTVVFSIVMRSPPIGTSFPFFYATGLPVFAFFTGMSYSTGGAIRASRTFLQYPAVTWIDVVVARVLLLTLTSSVVFILTIALVMWIYSISTVLDLGQMLLAWFLAGFLGLGVGMVNCYLTGTFPAWGNAWALLTRPLFFISGVLLLPDNMPPWVAEIQLWNPVTHPVLMMRRAAFPAYAGDYISVLYPLGLSFVLLLVGLVLVRRNYQAILNG